MNNPGYRRIARWICETAEALEHAHQFGVIHRDIKPGNLLIDQRGHIWVADFGLAQVQADVQLTRTGDVLGTLRYMSPEQAAGNRVVLDHRTDIYSLGITFYELLTLEPAFAGEDKAKLLGEILNDEPRPPRAIDKHIPLELETIILKATAKAPAERYSSAQQMADDLQRWLDDQPIHARRPTLWERAARWRRRHQALVRAALVSVCLLAAGGLVSTIIIAREYGKTLEAYGKEKDSRAAAEESFRQAREAVDAFTALAEEELSTKPMFYQLRRRFLNLSLAYYRKFIGQRQGDAAVRDELTASSGQIERIAAELAELEALAPLVLLADDRVQKDLEITDMQREDIDSLLSSLSNARRDPRQRGPGGVSAEAQKRVVDLLRSNEQQVARVLSADQQARLKQIALQQRGPFAFKSPEVVAALDLSGEQRKQINDIIEANRLPPGDKDTPGERGGPEGRGPRERGPREGDVERRPREDFRRGPSAGEFGPDRPRPGEGERRDLPPREFSDEGPRRPPRDDRPRDGDRPPDDRPREDWGDDGPRRRDREGLRFGEGVPRGLRDRSRRTVEQIVALLTATQREKWQAMIGEPFPYDLGWRPDEPLPQ